MTCAHAPPPAGSLSERPASGGLYSIGAVSSMLGVAAATLRSWEERYGVVSPDRTAAGHRLYTREQVDQLRFVAAGIGRGLSAADAHRSLAKRMLAPPDARPHRGARPRLLILIAERDEYSAELIEFLLRTEGFGVEVALEVDQAKDTFEQSRPDLTVLELLVDGGAGTDLCRWFKGRSMAPVLAISHLDAADRALAAGADAFLLKPVGHLQLVSAVKDLLGVSAMLDPGG
jgi:DNA-binding transcriptional MerR regulator